MSHLVRGKTFIVSGPSGVGKGTVLKELFKNQPHAPDLIWLDTSPECLRKSVCNAVLNEFFNN